MRASKGVGIDDDDDGREKRGERRGGEELTHALRVRRSFGEQNTHSKFSRDDRTDTLL